MDKLPAVLLRGVKPLTDSGLESTDSTHTGVGAALIAEELDAIAEKLSPRSAAIDLRRTPIGVTSKTANNNSVKIQHG